MAWLGSLPFRGLRLAEQELVLNVFLLDHCLIDNFKGSHFPRFVASFAHVLAVDAPAVPGALPADRMTGAVSLPATRLAALAPHLRQRVPFPSEVGVHVLATKASALRPAGRASVEAVAVILQAA